MSPLNLENYIVKLINVVPCGNAVIVGHYLITSGHLFFNNNVLYFMHDDIKYELHKEHALFYEDVTQGIGKSDIAIFNFENFSSPLKIASTLPAVGDNLLNVHYKHFIFAEGENSKFIHSNGVVLELIEDFFMCDMKPSLYDGSSGSPILYGDVVYGIVCGGYPDKDERKILFQSLKSIQEVLK